VKIAFLVYDSRSGSTLLSREITASLGDVFVTPEIGFDSLFSMGDSGLAKNGWAIALRCLYESHDFTNFDVPYDRALWIVNNDGQPLSLSQGVRALIKEFSACHNYSEAAWVIIKNGSHLRWWREMHQFFGDDLYLLYIVRDPRAVISSKLRTARPYHPGEVMAWGGVVPAAIRWRIYANSINSVKEKNIKICELRYEDLVQDRERELNRISKFMSIPQSGSKGIYSVPETEKLIHKLVESHLLDADRIDAWRSQLSILNQYRVEAICRAEMVQYNYTCMESRVVKKWAACLLEMPSICYKVVRHTVRTKLRKM